MSFSSSFPDYYALLGVQNTATQAEIRQAYKRESLKSHPDRLVNASPEQKRLATEKFQVREDKQTTFSFVLLLKIAHSYRISFPA